MSMIKVVVLAANPHETNFLRLDREINDIQSGLKQYGKYRDRFTFVPHLCTSTGNLRRFLLNEAPRIVHFCGHASEMGLLFQDGDDRGEFATNEAIADLFAVFAKEIECVVLNACNSEPLAILLAQHLNYAIGMNESILDDAAREFSIGFYDALGAGRTVEESFAVGRNAIAFKPDLADEALKPSLHRKSGELYPFIAITALSEPSSAQSLPKINQQINVQSVEKQINIGEVKELKIE